MLTALLKKNVWMLTSLSGSHCYADSCILLQHCFNPGGFQFNRVHNYCAPCSSETIIKGVETTYAGKPE